ncbi:hypothetical protein [Pseudomonas fluvialis]|uniref:hypothetical protein n=1 Tax=Pseudomonas fluvialis TaxID=1793966 RepID=UPI0035B26350
MNKMSIDLKVGETLTIGGATVRLVKKSGQLARLEVCADPSIQIDKPRQRDCAGSAHNRAHQPQQ